MARRSTKVAMQEDALPTGPIPRTTLTVIGHGEAEASVLQAWNQNRFHHAWFLSGPRGIGKATLAFKIARFLLNNPEPAGEGLFGPTGPADLNIPDDHPMLTWIAQDVHPDLAVIERKMNEKGKISAVIKVDDIRDIQAKLIQTRDDSWRVIIVDAAEDMNKNASNALLKMLEEPPSKCCFILISHAPNRVLPTIRSRCRRLDLKPVSNRDVVAILDQHDLEASAAVLTLANGSPGRALRLADAGVDDVLSIIDQAIAGDLDSADSIAVAERMSGRDAQSKYELYLELFPDRMGTALKNRKGDLEPAFALWDRARKLSQQAAPLSYDPLLVIHELNSLARQFSKMI
jgi:DNA polymerase III subunit delta'